MMDSLRQQASRYLCPHLFDCPGGAPPLGTPLVKSEAIEHLWVDMPILGAFAAVLLALVWRKLRRRRLDADVMEKA